MLAVYTGADLVKAGLKPLSSQPMFPGPGGAKAPQTPRHALAVGEVRFVGEAVVAVVGTTADAARAGRDAVLVDYEELPNVVHLDDAISRRGAQGLGRRGGQLCRPRCATAAPKPAPRPSPRPRTW